MTAPNGEGPALLATLILGLYLIYLGVRGLLNK